MSQMDEEDAESRERWRIDTRLHLGTSTFFRIEMVTFEVHIALAACHNVSPGSSTDQGTRHGNVKPLNTCIEHPDMCSDGDRGFPFLVRGPHASAGCRFII